MDRDKFMNIEVSDGRKISVKAKPGWSPTKEGNVVSLSFSVVALITFVSKIQDLKFLTRSDITRKDFNQIGKA